MKNFFDFKLRGNEIFSYYLCIFIYLIIFLYTLIQFATVNSNITAGVVPADTIVTKEFGMYIVGIFIYVITVLIFSFHITRESVQAVSYNGEELRFEGTLGEYLKIALLGFVLSIISLGVYVPWFYKNITDFYTKSTSYKNVKFRFNGSALMLLLIIFIPSLILGVSNVFMALVIDSNPMMIWGYVLVMYLIISVMIYLEYRWFLNLSYDDSKIKMAMLNPILGSLYIFKEFVLSIFTLGLYIPAAIIHISRFYINRLEEIDECNDVLAKFGTDLSIKEDFFYIFAQCLLCIITFGVYLPWTYANITRRIINKTYKINNY